MNFSEKCQKIGLPQVLLTELYNERCLKKKHNKKKYILLTRLNHGFFFMFCQKFFRVLFFFFWCSPLQSSVNRTFLGKIYIIILLNYLDF